MNRHAVHFVLHKLHSLLGVVPLGAFAAWHLFVNSAIVFGPAAFDRAHCEAYETPYLEFMEVVLLGIPLAFHALYGVYIWLGGRCNLARAPSGPNLRYSLQRWTGAYLLAFLIYHVLTTRLQLMADYQTCQQQASFAAHMVAALSQWGALIAYSLAVAASSFHLANGLWNVGVNWGMLRGRRCQQLAAYGCFALGILLFLMGMNVLFHLRTGEG